MRREGFGKEGGQWDGQRGGRIWARKVWTELWLSSPRLFRILFPCPLFSGAPPLAPALLKPCPFSGHPIHTHGFNARVYTDDSQISIPSPWLSPDPWVQTLSVTPDICVGRPLLPVFSSTPWPSPHHHHWDACLQGWAGLAWRLRGLSLSLSSRRVSWRVVFL